MVDNTPCYPILLVYKVRKQTIKKRGYIMLTPNKQKFIDAASKHFGVGAIVGRNEINDFAADNGFSKKNHT